ncbi:MAG: glycosyltransferase family 2 protein [Kiritimatiellia bacterium]
MMQDSTPTARVDLSLVVPVFRGADTLSSLHERIVRVCKTQGWTWELVLVDDGSQDGSVARIEELARLDSRVTGVFLTRNYGQHNATVAGIRESTGRLIATLDEDLQHPPEALPEMIKVLQDKNADVVYGVLDHQQHPFWRRLTSGAVHWLPRYVMGLSFNISSYRLMNRIVADTVTASARHDIILDVVIGWSTQRIAGCPIHHAAASRPSGYSLFSLISILFRLICGYTVVPLRIVLGAGVLLSTVAMVIGLRILALKLCGSGVPSGYTSLMVVVTFSSGLIMISLGLVAEYVARVFLQISRKPQSVVRRVVRGRVEGRGCSVFGVQGSGLVAAALCAVAVNSA